MNAYSGATVTLLILESDALLRRLLAENLGREADIQVVGSVAGEQAALDAVAELRPSLVLVDPDQLGQTRPRFLETLGAAATEAPLLVVLSGNETEQAEMEAARGGARGFVAKSQADSALPEALRAVARGELWFTPRASARILREYQLLLRRDRRSGEDTLSEREREVLARIARGMTNPQIARDLFLSVHTIKLHVQKILRKLDLPNRTEAAVFATRQGLVDGHRVSGAVDPGVGGAGRSDAADRSSARHPTPDTRHPDLRHPTPARWGDRF